MCVPTDVLRRIVAAQLAIRRTTAAVATRLSPLLLTKMSVLTKRLGAQLGLSLPVSATKQLVLLKKQQTDTALQWVVFVQEYEESWGCWVNKYMRAGCGECWLEENVVRQIWRERAWAESVLVFSVP